MSYGFVLIHDPLSRELLLMFSGYYMGYYCGLCFRRTDARSCSIFSRIDLIVEKRSKRNSIDLMFETTVSISSAQLSPWALVSTSTAFMTTFESNQFAGSDKLANSIEYCDRS